MCGTRVGTNKGGAAEVAAGDRAGRTMHVRVDGDLYQWLRAKSFFEGRSMNTLVLEALARKRAVEAPHELWHGPYLGR